MNTSVNSKHNAIHNKILFLQSIVEDIHELGEHYGVNLQAETKHLFGRFENISFEEIEDNEQMDSWLHRRRCQIEYQYNYSINKLVNCKPELKEALINLLTKSGVNLAITLKEYYLTAIGIYTNIQAYMPDINVDGNYNQLVMESDSEVVWITGISTPSPFLEEVGGSNELYNELCEAWMEGFVRELGYHFERVVAGSYRIYL